MDVGDVLAVLAVQVGVQDSELVQDVINNVDLDVKQCA